MRRSTLFAIVLMLAAACGNGEDASITAIEVVDGLAEAGLPIQGATGLSSVASTESAARAMLGQGSRLQVEIYPDPVARALGGRRVAARNTDGLQLIAECQNVLVVIGVPNSGRTEEDEWHSTAESWLAQELGNC